MGEELLKVVNLKKYFPVRMGFFSRRSGFVKAVDGISFMVDKGEIFGLVGESGCGKTTTGRTILRLIEPTDGEAYFEGVNIFSLSRKEFKPYRRYMQMIFQDPYESLNPRRTVAKTIEQSINIHKLANSEEEKKELIIKALEEVELRPPEEFLDRYPHMLSGGQRQRVAIARAIVLRPKFIVADEPVSMLDVSIRAGILRLLMKLRDDMGISFLYITHDLATAKYICRRMAVMYLGKIVELGPTIKVIDEPLHPYTKALIKAIPVPDPKVKIGEVPIKGEVPLSPIDLPSGCRFHPRCLMAEDICKKKEPEFREVEPGRWVACHLV